MTSEDRGFAPRMARYCDEVAALARPVRDPGDLDVLLDRAGDARVVMLGEASHGTHEFYAWRAVLTRRLIEEGHAIPIARVVAMHEGDRFAGDVEVAGPVYLLQDGERAKVRGPSFSELALGIVQDAEVVEGQRLAGLVFQLTEDRHCRFIDRYRFI